LNIRWERDRRDLERKRRIGKEEKNREGKEEEEEYNIIYNII
jgi:hypothetical protein